MTSIEEIEDQITSQFEELGKILDKIGKLEGKQRQTSIKDCEKKLKEIMDDIQIFEIKISDLERHQEQQYKKKLDKFQDKLKLVKSQYDYKKNEGNAAAEKLYGDRQQKIQQDLENKDIRAMNCNNIFQNTQHQNNIILQYIEDQMIKHAEDLQQDGFKRLNEIQVVLIQDIELAEQINTELDRQIAKLDGVKANVMDTQTALKRTGKMITYFAKQVSTDKILMCLLCTIVLIIVILIILSATGYGNFKIKK